MKPAAFEYVKAQSVSDCLEVLAAPDKETKLLSGGQSLVPLMNLRLARPEVLVDMNGLDELAYERRDNGLLELGALERHADLAGSPNVEAAAPMLAYAASLIGYPAIRNRGTLGGSLAHADPAAELPCACLALDAEIVVRSSTGERRLPSDDFFVSHFTTALEPTEMVTAVRVPTRQHDQGWAFEEFARKSGDFAVAAVACVISMSGGCVEQASIALAGAGARPMRARRAETALAGEAPSDELFADAGALVSSEVGEWLAQDLESWRPHVAGVLTTRALATAANRANGEGGLDGK